MTPDLDAATVTLPSGYPAISGGGEAEPHCPDLSRRGLLHGAAAIGALGLAGALAACGSDNADSSRATGDTGAGGALASTADIPVGGGVILDSPIDIVITQPASGDFKAYSSICTHQRCPVGSVEDNVITCPCHSSTFDASTGEPLSGPAPSALAAIAITVTGAEITLA